MTIGCSTLSKQSFTPQQAVKLTAESWTVLFTGQGRVEFDADGIRMAPRTAKSADETFSALAVLKTQIPFRDFRLRVRYDVVRQLREVNPHSWETLWVLFGFRTDSHHEWRGKETNYAVLKTNGIELGRAWGNLDQKFLKTREHPRLEMGRTQTLYIERSLKKTCVTFESNPAFCFADGAWPESAYDHPGTIGLYAEDAEVLVRSVEIDRSSVGEKDRP